MALHHAKPGEVVDLAPIGRGLRQTKTAALIKAHHFEAVRLIVHAGSEIPQHKVSGEITLHCLEGHVELGVDAKGRSDQSALMLGFQRQGAKSTSI